MPQIPVIDSHAQLGTGEIWFEPKFQVDYRIEKLLARADEAGIQRMCVMAPRNRSYDAGNREVARLCAKYPNRLIGFAVHHMESEAGRLQSKISEEVKSQGFRGIKLDGAPTREVLDIAAELSIPVMYYPIAAPNSG